jgi:hypothetical protein
MLEVQLEPLLQAHWEEIARHTDTVNILNPDYARYYHAQSQNRLRIYTVRDDDSLVGYSIYFLNYNIHYQQSLRAFSDAIYVKPKHRGLASIRLLKYAEQELKADDIEVITIAMKIGHDHPELLNYLGYDDAEILREKVIKEV